MPRSIVSLAFLYDSEIHVLMAHFTWDNHAYSDTQPAPVLLHGWYRWWLLHVLMMSCGYKQWSQCFHLRQPFVYHCTLPQFCACNTLLVACTTSAESQWKRTTLHTGQRVSDVHDSLRPVSPASKSCLTNLSKHSRSPCVLTRRVYDGDELVYWCGGSHHHHNSAHDAACWLAMSVFPSVAVASTPPASSVMGRTVATVISWGRRGRCHRDNGAGLHYFPDWRIRHRQT